MSTTVPADFNYAATIGISSLAAAIVFSVVYAALLVVFLAKSFTHPTYVHYVLTFFCTIRVTAFIIRAVLAGSESAGENLGLVIANEILSSVGYFGLLYSAYTLVLDRTLLSDLRAADHPILKFTQDRRAFRLLLMVGVIIGIVAGSEIGSSNVNPNQIEDLRIASVVIFLVLTVVQALQTGILATSSVSGHSQYYIRGKDSYGIRYGNHILLLISLLLLIREVFSISTVKNLAKQDNEHFWYPFIALPEVLVVILYITPGLVPKRDEIDQYTATHTTPEDKATSPA